MKKAAHILFRQKALFMVIGLLISGFSPVFGVQGVVPYSKVLKDALNVATTHSNWVVAQGQGDSMAPYYDSHTLLLIEKIPYPELRPGMIAVYKDTENQLVGHSLTELSEEGWTAQGFNNPNPDPALVTADNFIGIIFGTLKYNGEPTDPTLKIVHGKKFN